ncbi:hypothetical protein D9758_012875 [Tetrapyrgos nigripes]|uniref:Uncharacterized protein n=1 Tax=Tetrapyrgos nigripes TaxID=182062 RepID=A0A8H5CLK7_9AGAR|nr:hypothetical protein D9758_012875 [Tetrapyrgos nigripes]
MLPNVHGLILSGCSPAEVAQIVAKAQAAQEPREFRAARLAFEDQGEYEREEDEGPDLIDLAEEDRQKGNLKTAEALLTFVLLQCKMTSNVVKKLRVHVNLAHVLYEQEEYAKASEEFQAAYDLHQDWMTDNDRSLRPVSYLPLWAECYDKLSQHEKAERLRKEQKEVDERYRSYWGDSDDDKESDEESGEA